MKRCPNFLVRRCEKLAMVDQERGRGRLKKYWGEVIRKYATYQEIDLR